MDTLEIIVSSDKSIVELPENFVKVIIAGEDDSVLINPIKKEYFIKSYTRLKFGKHTLVIDALNQKVSVGKVSVGLHEGFLYVNISHGNVLFEPYPDLLTFKEKYGIIGQYPKD